MAKKAGKRSRFGWVFKDRSAGVWRVRITLPNGKRQQFTAGPTRELANQLLSRLEYQMAQASVLGEEAVMLDRVRFDAYLPEFFDRISTRFSPQTVESYRCCARLISKEIGSMFIDAVTARDIRRLQDKLYRTGKKGKRSDGTVNRILLVGSTIFREAINEGYARKNPVREITLARSQTREFNLPSFTARKEMLERFDPRIRDAAEFSMETGLRVGELLRLDADHDIDWDDDVYGSILVRTKVKNKVARRVPLTKEAAAALRRMIAARDRDGRKQLLPWKSHRENFRRIWAKSLDSVGLRGKLRWHDLRHIYAATVAASGGGLPEVARLLGNKIQAAQRYADHTPENYRVRMVRRLEDLRREEGRDRA